MDALPTGSTQSQQPHEVNSVPCHARESRIVDWAVRDAAARVVQEVIRCYARRMYENRRRLQGELETGGGGVGERDGGRSGGAALADGTRSQDCSSAGGGYGEDVFMDSWTSQERLVGGSVGGGGGGGGGSGVGLDYYDQQWHIRRATIDSEEEARRIRPNGRSASIRQLYSTPAGMIFRRGSLRKLGRPTTITSAIGRCRRYVSIDASLSGFAFCFPLQYRV